MRIALVHDYLNEAGGAERVLLVLSDMYPEAPIYTAFAKNGSAKKIFNDRKIIESKWGWFLKIGRFYSYFRFLLPWVWESIDLTKYDLVITSCSGYIARGFKVKDTTTVLAYCHTPPKWLYGYETPTDGKNHWWGRAYMWAFGPWVRYFDYRSAQRVNVWIANSKEVANRVRKFYRKEAVVVYPPAYIATRNIAGRPAYPPYYLTVARVVGAKGLVEAARAMKAAKRKLIVVGEVMVKNYEARIMNDGGKWVEMKGRVSEEELGELYAGARGYLALARDEDFGMTAVEAMSYGVPVLALKSGGYKETVKEGVTGLLIESSGVKSVAEGIDRLEKTKWNKTGIQNWAKTFNRERFEKEIRRVIGA